MTLMGRRKMYRRRPLANMVMAMAEGMQVDEMTRMKGTRILVDIGMGVQMGLAAGEVGSE